MAVATLRDLWERNAIFHPRQLALVANGTRRTYAEVVDRAAQFANSLLTNGVKRGDRVAILSMNRIEYMEVLAANHILGSIAATLNFRLTAAELEWIINDCSPEVLVFEDRYLKTVDQLREKLPSIKHFVVLTNDSVPDWATPYKQLTAGAGTELPALRPEAEDIAHIIYTSGTTGRPKGVMLSHRAQVNLAESVAGGIDVKADSRILQVMPLFHTGAQGSSLGILWKAGTVHIHPTFEPEKVLAAVENERLTHLHLVPLMVQELLNVSNAADYDISSLETILYAAAPITPAVLRKALAQFGPVFVGAWGMTEGTGTFLPKHAHLSNDGEKDIALLSSVGQESQRSEIRIVDEAGDDCTIGQPGELLLRSGTMLSGYWNNSAATIEAMGDGWLKTGDMGYFDEYRNIYLVDRKKDMIISGGENIYSQEVERALAEHADVESVAVIGVPNERWGEAVKAVVVLRAGVETDADLLIEHCSQLIASYKKPRSVEFIDKLPALPSGKVNKLALRKMFTENENA